MAKKDFLKAGLGTSRRKVKKMETIGEEQANEITDKIHTTAPKEKQPPTPKTPKAPKKEPELQTTVYFPKSLHKTMKRKLLDIDLNMKDYLIMLIKKDLGIKD